VVKDKEYSERQILSQKSNGINMYSDFTFSIIKPNAVRTGKTGPILAMINEGGFEIAAMRMVKLTLPQAESFYSVHKGKPFYPGLIEFMTSGPVVVMILRHENAVEQFRKLIGNTDPAKAEPGTIRKTFAVSVQMNAVHGSDSVENAAIEANFFFSGIERFY
jgi:nucleoside-diphosphate kinase